MSIKLAATITYGGRRTVKIPGRLVFLAWVIAGLIYDHASLEAQPASGPAPTTGGAARPDEGAAPASDEPVVTDEPDKPWEQGVSAEDRQAARELFLEGNRLFKIPLFARAVEKYAAAVSKWKHPAFYFNLALAQLNLGQEVEARASLEHALAYGKEPLGEKEFQEAQAQLEDVKRKLGRIHVTCQTRGAEVTLDGATLFTGPGSYEGWIKAKTHELTAKKPGYQSEARRVVVPSGEFLNIDLSLVTLSQAADTHRRWATWKPWAVVASGLGVAAAGGVLHAVSANKFNTYDKEFSEQLCARANGCEEAEIPQRLRDKLNLAKQLQTFAVGGYVVGGSLVATGIVLLYLNRPRLAEGPVNSPMRGLAVTPTVSGDMLGVLVGVNH